MTALKRASGFTLIELIAVIIIVSALAATALPRFIDLGSAAKEASLESIAGAMRSTINLARAKAFADGLSLQASNPGSGQSELLVDFGFGSAEVDWRNLCPESRAELGDQLTMLDFINISTSGGLTTDFNNQYTWSGYDLTSGVVPTGSGCYVRYDSFGDPLCEVIVIVDEC